MRPWTACTRVRRRAGDAAFPQAFFDSREVPHRKRDTLEQRLAGKRADCLLERAAGLRGRLAVRADDHDLAGAHFTGNNLEELE